jgi:hypothetical protein
VNARYIESVQEINAGVAQWAVGVYVNLPIDHPLTILTCTAWGD